MTAKSEDVIRELESVGRDLQYGVYDTDPVCVRAIKFIKELLAHNSDLIKNAAEGAKILVEENRRLLAERNSWEKCAKNIEFTYKEVKVENRRLSKALKHLRPWVAGQNVYKDDILAMIDNALEPKP